jgi:hypothetical protein
MCKTPTKQQTPIPAQEVKYDTSKHVLNPRWERLPKAAILESRVARAISYPIICHGEAFTCFTGLSN